MNPYVDPETGVHFNKAGIRDKAELRRVEYAVTKVRIAELQVEPIKGDFDLKHLTAIHERLFGDLYEWAGKPRTLNFSKVDAGEPWWKSKFAPHDKIGELSEGIASDLRDKNYLRGLKQPEFTKAIADVYARLNELHPMPEGNGRSTQTMLTQLAREAGYDLNFKKVDPKEWNVAAGRSMQQVNVREPALTRKADPTLIREVFKRIVEPLDQQREAPKAKRSDPER